jgi:hypothetical protein
MMGLVSRLAAAARGRTDSSDADAKEEGVVWVARNECRTCRAPISDPESAPTAVDTSDVICNASASDRPPRSTFCCEECREEFVDVFGGGK